jgi:hypothetical protein
MDPYGILEGDVQNRQQGTRYQPLILGGNPWRKLLRVI